MGASRRVRWMVAIVVGVLTMSVIGTSAQAPASTYIDFWTISSYDYNPKEPFEPAPLKASGTIPASVRELEGRKVRIYGNTLALDYSSGEMSEFILHASADACGYGATPRINEWIYVTMANGRKTRVSTGLERIIEGTFHIREQVESGRVVGLYAIVADTVK